MNPIFFQYKLPIKRMSFVFILLFILINQAFPLDLMASNVSDYYEKGKSLEKKGQIYEALKYYEAAINEDMTDGERKDRKAMTNALIGSAGIYAEKENVTEAMTLYLKALDIADKEHLLREYAEACNGIGTLYSKYGDIDSGLRFYRMAFNHASSDSIQPLTTFLFNNIINTYYLKKDVDSVRKYAHLLEKYPAESPIYTINVMMSRGFIQTLTGSYSSAATTFKSVAAKADSLGLPLSVRGAAISQLAGLYEQQEMYDSASYYLKTLIRDAERKNNVLLLMESLKQLSVVCAIQGHEREALNYKSQYLNIADSINSTDKYMKMKNAQMLYESEKSGNLIKSLNTEKRIKEVELSSTRKLTISMAAFVIILSIFLWISILQKKRLKVAYRVLYDKSRIDEEIPSPSLPHFYPDKNCPEIIQSERIANPVSEPRKKQLLEQITQFMQTNETYCEDSFTIERFAELIGSNSKYISTVINEYYGCNFRSYIGHYRIKKAEERLRDVEKWGHLTINAIAESVGYKSYSSFNAMFIRQTGMSPKAFRNLAKEETYPRRDS